MGKFIDLTGQKFGRLTVIKRAENKNDKVAWLCECDCPQKNKVIVRANDLRMGVAKSCGCLSKETTARLFTKHGKAGTKLYQRWIDMKDRCNNPHNIYFFNYGGRGIKVCKEWLHDFQTFQDWAIANGYKEKLTLDRKNVDGNYEPSNCRWITMKEQNNNKRNNRLITYKGEIHTAAEWSVIKGIHEATIRHRLDSGWSVEKALITPVRKQTNKKIS